MTRHERLNGILTLLSQRGQLEVDELAAELVVSAATVRRDLDHLADQQLLRRTHGGAVPTGASYDLPLRYRSADHTGAKAAIAQAAVAMVAFGQSVALNGGTTTSEVARALANSPALTAPAGRTSLTVITNALNIATELAVRPHVKIVVLGGVARPQSYELVGPLAEATLAQVNADITFLGVDAVDPERGAMAQHEGEARINRELARRSSRVVIVADRSKLGARAFAQICDTDAIDVLLTDTDPGLRVRRAFGAHGVEVVVAEAVVAIT